MNGGVAVNLREMGYKKAAMLLSLAVSLFIVGTVIGISGSSSNSNEKVETESEVETVEDKQGVDAEKKKIVLQDELIEKSLAQVERDGELYVVASEFADLMGLKSQWNSISQKLILKGESKHLLVDVDGQKLVYGDELEESVELMGEKKSTMVPLSKVSAFFGYQMSKLDELGIYRIKTPEREMLDIELSKKYAEEFGVEIEDYDYKYRREKTLFLEAYPEYREPLHMRPIPQEKVAYLTFDDGPNHHTEDILDILKKYDIKATFFVLGKVIPGNEDTLRRTFEEGHQLGLHSMTHEYSLVYASPESFLKEMDDVNQMIFDAVGIKSKLVRPPYGSVPGLKQDFRDLVVENRYRVWDWNIDSGDSHGNVSSDYVYNTTVSQASRYSGPVIILFHDKANTVGALPRIIEYLSSRGYSFEVIGEDLHPFNFWNDERYID